MSNSVPPSGNPSAPPSRVRRSGREAYRRARTRRQTVVFGAAIIALLALFFVGLMGAVGLFPVPLKSEFSRPVHTAEPGDVPCPSQGARPTDPDEVGLRILNTTSTPGLAGTIGKRLEEVGYEVVAADNAPPYRGGVKIEAGPDWIDDAYTLARYFEGEVRVVLSSSEDNIMTVMLGAKFESLVPKKMRKALKKSHASLIPPAGCLRLPEQADVPQSQQSD